MKKSLSIGTLFLTAAMLLCACKANAQSTPQADTSAPASAAVETAAADAGTGAGDDYPKNPVTLVVPFSAGGAIDTLCRTLGPFMGNELGTNFVIEDMPGAGSQVGLSYLVQTANPGRIYLI